MAGTQFFRRGFTLIELLIVIAVVAVIASLLLPALASAKASAKRASCLANHKQLTLAWTLYASENRDWLVPNAKQPNDPNHKLWVQGAFVNPPDNLNASLIMDPQFAAFAPYVPARGTYVCPADRPYVTIGGTQYPKLRSYELNAYVGWTDAWDFRLAPGYRIFRKLTDVGRQMPNGLLLFADVQPDSICWPYFGVEMDMDYFFNFPGGAHSHGGVLSFADGSAQWHRWVNPTTLAAQSPSYHSHHDASPTNSDLAWLRLRTTYPDSSPAGSGGGGIDKGHGPGGYQNWSPD